MNLADLCAPFPQEDVEWRVSRAGIGKNGTFCFVFCYITARAVQQRLDDVCGPENWQVGCPVELNTGKPAFAVGISIRIGEDWITKWDVAEPTNIQPAKGGFSGSVAKGGFSGAVKRAGAQWGIGRYLYHIDELFAETSESDPGVRGWHYARLPEKQGGSAYFWKEPSLPGWALPKEKASEITTGELNDLKKEWVDKFARESQGVADLREGFRRFVLSICGDFPIADHTCWTREAWNRCRERIESTTDPNGVSSDVPFEE